MYYLGVYTTRAEGQQCSDNHGGEAVPVEIRKDPVCGMDIPHGEAAGSSQFGEWVYFFCSQRCKEDFDRDPIKYLLKK
jgi:YHS domain-containing protein